MKGFPSTLSRGTGWLEDGLARAMVIICSFLLLGAGIADCICFVKIYPTVHLQFVHLSVFTSELDTGIKNDQSTGQSTLKLHSLLHCQSHAGYGSLCHSAAGGRKLACSQTRLHFVLLSASSSGALGVGRNGRDREDVSPVNWKRRLVLLTGPQQKVLLSGPFPMPWHFTPCPVVLH